MAKERNEINENHKWDLEPLYKTIADWEADFKKVSAQKDMFKSLKGTLGESAENLYKCLNQRDELLMMAENVYVYAHLKHDEDTSNPEFQAFYARANSLITEVYADISFIDPEILEMDDKKLQAFLESHEKLSIYKHHIDAIVRLKEHTLSDDMEEVLAKVSEVGQAAYKIFSMLTNADLKFGTIKGEDGNERELTNGSYIGFLQSKDRNVRKAAFTALYKAYIDHKNTLAESYAASVRNDIFFTRQRKYESCLDASLKTDNIPTSVYHNLVKSVNAHLPSLHKYMDISKKTLGVDALHMYDVYVPLVSEMDKNVDYDTATETVIKSLAPMGDEYVSALKEGLKQRWIDIYENKGKRSGAYSSGSYSSYPYILLNYDDKLGDMFTLTHELGHSMQSYFSKTAQPFVYGDYTIFVAEVASTVNEALLMEHLLKTETDPAMRKYLINYYIEQFRSTVFRQTMFAEFELKAHEVAESGEALTSQVMNQMYRELNKKYFGKDVVIDEEIDYEWSRIPHFYRAFYVYQYATGFSAAVALSKKILDGDVDGYMAFLKSGSSLYPIEQLKLAGVDMSQPEAVNMALETFGKLVDELEKL